MIVRKDDSLCIPVILPQKVDADIRDMQGATWRDVVAAVLEQCDEPVPLTILYEKLQSHKRVQKTKYWKEKIRQTLQYNPNHFMQVDRGVWAIKKVS